MNIIKIMKIRIKVVSRWMFGLCFIGLTSFACSGWASGAEGLNLRIDDQSIDRSNGASYAGMLEQAQKSVVSVYTAELVQYLRYSGSSRDDLLRDYLGLPPTGRRGSNLETHKVPQGVGSGVILNTNGYIVTNNHVISNKQGEVADEILVRLTNGKEYKARVVGRDPQTDIAVLKVDATGLPSAKIANSKQTKVGDIVFAIGNPMGVGLTVTTGIISAKNRNIGIYGVDGYENFIQTDASINPGNSGGALVDIKGRLIGINSAIVSRSGGNVGIGFAIPSNLAVDVSTQLTKTGKVQRRTIGVYIAPITEAEAEHFGLSNKSVVIKNVIAETAAAKAGLLSGDIITHINDKAIGGSGHLRSSIAHLKKGDTVKMKIWRQSKTHSVSMLIE